LVLNQRIKQHRVYNPAVHSRFVDRLIEGFTPELFDRLSGAGDETEQRNPLAPQVIHNRASSPNRTP
jgi:hypothetical protein